MSTTKQQTHTIEVPANTGVEGFLVVMRQVLQLPKVQKVVIDCTGRVTYQRVVQEGEENSNVNVSFDHIQPYAIIRNGQTKELTYPGSMSAAAIIGAMFDVLAFNSLTPIAFVVSPQTTLWSWLYFSSALEVHTKSVLFGCPLLLDKHIPTTALVLCAGVDGTKAVVDTRVSIKVEIPRLEGVLGEDVAL